MLPEKIKKMEQKFPILENTLKLIRKIDASSKNFNFEIQATFRSFGVSSKKYDNIKKFKNIHKGEKCFIIATGPSITITDIEKLRNEYTFGMNSLSLAFKLTDFRPTYFGIQDEHVYEKIKDSLKLYCKENVFVSSNIAEINDIPITWNTFPLNVSYHSYQLRFNQQYFAKFSSDCNRAVYDGYTITYSLLQLAIYMGFKEVYLLGADTNYSKNKNKQHFIESGHYDPTYKTAGERMIVAYEVAKKYADTHNINIYNATRGGMLEVFPRVDLDEVLGLKEGK